MIIIFDYTNLTWYDLPILAVALYTVYVARLYLKTSLLSAKGRVVTVVEKGRNIMKKKKDDSESEEE